MPFKPDNDFIHQPDLPALSTQKCLIPLPASPTASRDDRICESVWTLHYHLTRTRPVCRRLIWAPCRPSAHAAEGLFVLWSSGARRPLVVGDFFCPFFDSFSGLQLLSSDLLQPGEGFRGSLRSLTVQGSHICRSDWETAFVVLFRVGKTVTVYFIICLYLQPCFVSLLRNTGKRAVMSPCWPHYITSCF